MRLFRSAKHETRWFAFGSQIGWVIFPAEIAGWQKRQPARDIDLWLGFNTGIPGAYLSADEAPALSESSIKPASVPITCKLKKCSVSNEGIVRATKR
jgi:hypothetical protein